MVLRADDVAPESAAWPLALEYEQPVQVYERQAPVLEHEERPGQRVLERPALEQERLAQRAQRVLALRLLAQERLPWEQEQRAQPFS